MVGFRRRNAFLAVLVIALDYTSSIISYNKPEGFSEQEGFIEYLGKAGDDDDSSMVQLPESFSTDNPRFNHFIKLIENTHIPSMMFKFDTTKERFDHLVMNRENLEDFQFMESLLVNRKNGKIGDISIPTSYTVYGPKGNGRKSWIYKLASSVGAHVVYINCVGLVCPYLQVASINLRQLYEIVTVLSILDSKKVFLILENIDVIAPRGTQNTFSLVRDLELVLKSMFDQGSFNIFTFAVVEDRFSIDLSLLGNDKLGFSFGFEAPKEQAVHEYLISLAKKYSFSKSINLVDFSKTLSGHSFSAIETIVSNAYLASRKANKRTTGESELNAAIKSFQNSGLQEREATQNAQMRTEFLDGDSSLSIQVWSKGSVKYNFSDVIADDKTKEEVSDILLFIREPERFEKTKGKVPAGIILYGPTGTGKTLFAKALAGEAGCSFISVNASMLTSKYLGDSSRNIKNLFKLARKIAKQDSAPCIIFIDEIDSFAMKRGSSYGTVNDDNRQMLNQFLCELDGFSTEHGLVILVAATNRFADLDPAVKRPGRLDRHVCLPLPLLVLRKKMFELASTKFNFGPDVQIDELAKITTGFSGAEIMNMSNEAAIIAAKDNSDVITHQHLLLAHSKVTLGVENRSLCLSDRDKLVTAYHESGHALISLFCPDATPLKQLTCVPRGDALGVTLCYGDDDKLTRSEQSLFADLSKLFGGLIAEEILSCGSHDTGVASDLERATHLAEMMVCDYGMSPLGKFSVRGKYINTDKVAEAITDLLQKAEKNARDLLEAHKLELERLAKELVLKETMSVDDVKDLLSEVL